MPFDIPKTVTVQLPEELSAASIISTLAEAVAKWKQSAPENHVVAIRIQTPEGKLMRVAKIEAVGMQAFMATGDVDDKPYMVTGHISTLHVSCHFAQMREGEVVTEFTAVH